MLRAQGAVVFSLDVLNAYFHMVIKPSERYKTGFRFGNRQYRFCRLPMGASISSYLLSEMLATVFGSETIMEYQKENNDYTFTVPEFMAQMVVFCDDILLFSKQRKNHLRDISVIFFCLNRHNILINKHKCVF